MVVVVQVAKTFAAKVVCRSVPGLLVRPTVLPGCIVSLHQNPIDR